MSKIEADSLLKISIYWLRKNDYLHRWGSGSIQWTNSWSEKQSTVGIMVSTAENDSYLQINYTQTDENDEKRDFDYKIPLTSTPCYFGGKRYWFICSWNTNGKFCVRRVGVLYKVGDYFACRHCYDLTYSSRTQKRWGNCYMSNLSVPALEKLENEVKRKFYGGRPTRKYSSFLKKEDRFRRDLSIACFNLRKH